MKKVIFVFFVISLFSCRTTKETVLETQVEERFLDTLMVSAPTIEKQKSYNLPVFNPSATRHFDLIHTKLDLSFDWKNQYVLGTAWLTLRPYFYDNQYLSLDAVGFDIHEVKLQGKKAPYEYNGEDLIIDLGRPYSRDMMFDVEIKYTAKPNDTPAGGSAAITSEKGLFFINPLNSNPDKPQQIWTQGETENNSRWFPTIDKPNERCSQEISMTVEDRFATLSNGKLISSKKNSNGTRTDVWSQEKPHAPYLFMVGVGEYAVVKERVKDIELMYYVEPEYEEDAKLIFNHTGEMIEFFSDKLGYPFPWDKYAQIVCADFVSGAMENTGAVTFGDFVQRHKRQLTDDDNDYIVAHELFHHWFGDLVTCESWANLTMNEGFANYSEYMWFEYKYGKDRADHHRLNEMNGYVNSLNYQEAHPLIHYGYDDKEQMFDAHSYNKGGLVLHMLRSMVGDDAFYTSLNKYLVDHEYTDVEADELRLAFEDITGQDLIWFFDQWYHAAGHPILDVTSKINENNQLAITVEQKQNPEKYPAIFILPTKIALYQKDGSVEYKDVTIDKRINVFVFDITDNYSWLSIDAYDDLLAEISYDLSVDQLKAKALQSPNFRDKFFALTKLKGKEGSDLTYLSSLKDPYYLIRKKAIQELSSKDQQKDKLLDLVFSDPHSKVRTAALKALEETTLDSEKKDLIDRVKGLIYNDPSYLTANAALSLINTLDPNEGIKLSAELKNDENKGFNSTIIDIYLATKDSKYDGELLDFLNEAEAVEFYFASQKLLPFLIEKDDELKLKAAKIYKNKANSDGPPFVKFASNKAIKELHSSLSPDCAKEIKEAFDAFLEETEP